MAKKNTPKADPGIVRKVREKKLSAKDMMKLAQEGKRADALALFYALSEIAENEPHEFIQENGKPALAKRRGKYVELAKDGTWKLAPKK